MQLYAHAYFADEFFNHDYFGRQPNDENADTNDSAATAAANVYGNYNIL